MYLQGNRVSKHEKVASDDGQCGDAVQMTPKLLVCAIDFGTTYSGWAYSFTHEYRSDPTKTNVRHWNSGSDDLVTEKTPTCVLIAADGKTLEAFGYDAENKYTELAEKNEHRDYFYFRRFKMALDTKKISKDLMIRDEMGRSLSALTVFSLSIEFLADNVVQTCNDQVSGVITREDVHWVLTVPGIWNDAAKQFMRQAAKKAKITDLTIALEPEVASVFCRHLPDAKDKTMSLSTFPPGTKYLVLDAGGGTVDITVHEISSSGGLKEVHAADGGGWGGVLADEAFKDLLLDMCGKEVYEAFTTKEPEDWLDLWRSFEVKKKTIGASQTATINIRIPPTLMTVFKDHTGHDLADAIKNSKFSENIELRMDKLICNANLMMGLFDKSIKTAIMHVEKVLDNPKVGKVEAILMVGGMSTSPMLKEAVMRKFDSMAVIIPSEAASAVLRGAVIFGHNPNSISQRVLRKTYGTNVADKFIVGKHRESKQKIIDGVAHCRDLFSKHVEWGQTVTVGETQVEC